MIKAYTAKPNEWIFCRKKVLWQCCDCGLVHNVFFKLTDLAQIAVYMTRNKKETDLARKLKKKKPNKRLSSQGLGQI